MKRPADKEGGIHPLLKDSFNIEPLKLRASAKEKFVHRDHHQIFFLRPSTILLLPKGQTYSFGNRGVTGHLLQFGDCFWQKAPQSAADCKALLFDKPGGPVILHPTPGNFKRIEALVTTTLDEFSSPDYPNKSDALAAYLKIIIIQLANIRTLLQPDTATLDGRLYQQFLTLVQDEARNIHQVSAFARKLGVSARKLTDCCSRFDTGPKEVINRQLIADAKRLLQFGSRSVKEVAGELNFANPYQFSHYFKKYTRLSPTAYRRQFADIGI